MASCVFLYDPENYGHYDGRYWLTFQAGRKNTGEIQRRELKILAKGNQY
jgi:hypothetical protein